MRLRALRRRDGGETPPVTSMELFFDLVYVFAVTQLSHHLLDHLTARGALQTLVLFMAVWWAWNYTAWATNWIDPDLPAVRALLLALMLLSLLMSAALPGAFADRGATFAAGYVAIQLLRGAFTVVALRDEAMRRNYAQLLAWSLIAGAIWIAGAQVDGDGRLLVWAGALVVDWAAPMHGFALPRLGRTPMRAWTLAGAHLAERCRLVLLIALGETVLAVGATYGALPTSLPVAAAFATGFAGTAALWWMYFGGAADAGARAIARSVDPARVGRGGYAYAHAVMVGGVIVVAVAIDLTIAHPTGPPTEAAAAVILGGPAIYLAGNAWFTRAVHRSLPWTRLLALAVLGMLAPLSLVASPLVLNGVVVALLAGLAAAGTLGSGTHGVEDAELTIEVAGRATGGRS